MINIDEVGFNNPNFKEYPLTPCYFRLKSTNLKPSTLAKCELGVANDRCHQSDDLKKILINSSMVKSEPGMNSDRTQIKRLTPVGIAQRPIRMAAFAYSILVKYIACAAYCRVFTAAHKISYKCIWGNDRRDAAAGSALRINRRRKILTEGPAQHNRRRRRRVSRLPRHMAVAY
ncbi:hypothetical protein EVAR_54345_1 [Eumeta japonica]|uniref:Uncharacterized protein n=1 Tax=Eumeta variegata TaxID=151549 RepID=A0A4C1Z630_EUMVA|nr:hypothetical protein EVAR_54345_1 [Eumeta japonica]